MSRLGAQRYERNDMRQTHRNGYRGRFGETQVGDIALRSPKLRRGSYGLTRALTRFRPGAVTRAVSGPEAGGSFMSPRVV